MDYLEKVRNEINEHIKFQINERAKFELFEGFIRILEIPNYTLGQICSELKDHNNSHRYLLQALMENVKIKDLDKIIKLSELPNDSIWLSQPIQTIADKILVYDKLISDLVLEKKIKDEKESEERAKKCAERLEKRKTPGFYFKDVDDEVSDDTCYYFFDESFEELRKLVNETFEETSVPLNENSWLKIQNNLSQIKKYFDTELENDYNEDEDE